MGTKTVETSGIEIPLHGFASKQASARNDWQKRSADHESNNHKSRACVKRKLIESVMPRPPTPLRQCSRGISFPPSSR